MFAAIKFELMNFYPRILIIDIKCITSTPRSLKQKLNVFEN
jgi:hypothetical protein